MIKYLSSYPLSLTLTRRTCFKQAHIKYWTSLLLKFLQLEPKIRFEVRNLHILHLNVMGRKQGILKNSNKKPHCVGLLPQHGTSSGCRQGRQPPDIVSSCEYTEWAVADSW